MTLAKTLKFRRQTEVNFFQVKEHLKNGGSVFITSKDSQKQFTPKPKHS